MKDRLHRKLKTLDDETERIYSDLSLLSEENLHDKSYGWSIIQVLSHLNIAEAGSVMYMKKKMKAGDQMQDSTFINQFKLAISKYFMQSNLKWKAPKVVASPSGDYSYQEIRLEWTKTREEIKTYIDEYPEKYMKKAVLKHPLAGRLTLEGALDSFIYHQRHHVYQIKRIRKKIGV